MLKIKDLHVAIENKKILKGFTLTVCPGEIHAIMGPNGAGKSTLAKILAGDPAYEVLSGEILFDGKDLLELAPEERACLGIFMGFQYPPEISGITNFQFLQAAYHAQRKAVGLGPLEEGEFLKFLEAKMAMMNIKPEFKERALNEGFSGGEKKRNEILQMAVLNPRFAILDETDSGLDIDALRIVATGMTQLMTPEKGLILITHYNRLLDYIKPHFIHVLVEGKIVASGGSDLALKLEESGYHAY